MSISSIIKSLLKHTLIGLRPLLGSDARCKFTITCTPYACQQLEEKPLIEAIKAIIKRLLACRPF